MTQLNPPKSQRATEQKSRVGGDVGEYEGNPTFLASRLHNVHISVSQPLSIDARARIAVALPVAWTSATKAAIVILNLVLLVLLVLLLVVHVIQRSPGRIGRRVAALVGVIRPAATTAPLERC